MIITKVFNKLNKIGFNNLIFQTPHLYSFGNYAEELLDGLKRAKLSNKKIFLLSPYNSKFLFGKMIPNEEILLLESRYIYDQSLIVCHVMKLLVTIALLPSRSFDRVLSMFGKSLHEDKVIPRVGFYDLWCNDDEMKSGFSWEVVDKYQWHDQIEDDYDLDISDIKSQVARSLLSEMGIDSSTWYVCLHVREPGFKNDYGRRYYRNSSINNYIPAIKVITDAGGVVVRMGDNTMTTLPHLPNVIDYAFSSKKSPLLDLYLTKHCRFFLGTDTGPIHVANLFLKDALITNMYHWMFAYPLRKNNRGIYKHVYSKVHRRYLTFHEVLSDDWRLQSIFRDIDDNYELTENTPEDIALAVSEYLQCHFSNNFSLSQNQIDVNKRRISQARIIYDKFNLSDDSDKFNPSDDSDNLTETQIKYRIASRVSINTQGSMCDSYLQKYLHNPYRAN